MIVSDWVEASLLQAEEEISRTKIADILHEQNIYDKDGSSPSMLCSEFISMLWQELRRRHSLIKKCAPYIVDRNVIKRTASWEERPAFSFLTMLTCLEYFPKQLQSGDFENTAITQGELFEEYCAEVLSYKGWRAVKTGWSSAPGKAKKLINTVNSVSAILNEKCIVHDYVKIHKNKNEAGCDLVGFWDFADKRTVRPILLIQCASGADYKKKLSTPELGLWNKFITFSTSPIRGFCTPRAFDDQSFMEWGSHVNGVLFDRHRLLEPLAESHDLSPAIKKRLVAWMRPRISALPEL